MAGCDGRMKSRNYYTDFAKALPKDTVILTAGCAKYKYNKLNLGDIGGIPRVLDAGQCNDSYSLAVIALKLKKYWTLRILMNFQSSTIFPGMSKRQSSFYLPPLPWSKKYPPRTDTPCVLIPKCCEGISG